MEGRTELPHRVRLCRGHDGRDQGRPLPPCRDERASLQKAQLIIVAEDTTAFECGRDCLQRLCSASTVTVITAVPENTEGMVSVVTTKARCFLPLSELVDLDKERERINKELDKNRKFLEGQEKKLSNQNFVSRAPENVVQAERDRAEQLRALIANLEESLKQLG